MKWGDWCVEYRHSSLTYKQLHTGMSGCSGFHTNNVSLETALFVGWILEKEIREYSPMCAVRVRNKKTNQFIYLT